MYIEKCTPLFVYVYTHKQWSVKTTTVSAIGKIEIKLYYSVWISNMKLMLLVKTLAVLLFSPFLSFSPLSAVCNFSSLPSLSFLSPFSRKCWSPCAQGRCHPTRRCTCRPSVTSWLSIKLLSLSLSPPPSFSSACPNSSNALTGYQLNSSKKLNLS